MTKDYLLSHKRKFHSGTTIECDICNKTFSDNGQMEKHKARMHGHTFANQFQCEICNKMFDQKYYLQRHKIYHKTKDSFKCEICGKKFKLKANLKKHISNIHNNSEVYKCRICDKEFNSKSNLEIIMKLMIKSDANFVRKVSTSWLI